ncbi:CvpA family protein [Geofilum rubicundum]|nr:CvpA family protein [Geofilum rubicundum]
MIQGLLLFDIIAGIFLLLFFLKGLKNGFVIELASLAALVLGIIGAVMFAEVTARWLSGFMESKHLSVVAFVMVFIAVVIAVHILAHAIDKLMKAIALGWINRLAGALFGLVKAAFLLSAVILLLESFGLGQKIFSPQTRHDSWLFEPLHRFAPATMNLFHINFDHLVPVWEEEKVPPPVIT